METIVILLDPRKLDNPDLDLRYLVPDRIEEVSGGNIQDNGYDYIDTDEEGVPLMGIWLQTEDAAQSWPVVLKVLREEKFLKNDLSASAEIYISEADAADLESCSQVFPEYKESRRTAGTKARISHMLKTRLEENNGTVDG